MNELGGFDAYMMWNALKLHFTSSYDYFKYFGRVGSIKKESFANKNDKYYFYRLSRKYSINDLRNFYISNLIDKEVKWIGEITNEEGEFTYNQWKKRNQSLEHFLEDDLESLFVYTKTPDEIILVNNNEYPKLLKMAMCGDICIETLCILNDVLKFLPMWTKKIDDDIVFPIWKQKIEKYTPFINFDKDRMKKIIKENIRNV